MKLTAVIILALSLSFTSRDDHQRAPIAGCTEIIDSANAFVIYGPFSLNGEPRTFDEEVALRMMKWLQQRPYAELLCLLKSDNKLHNMIGFVLVGEDHLDSLRSFFYLFDDTSSFHI